MRKKVLALALAAIVGLGATACGSEQAAITVPTVTVSGILPAQGDVIVNTTYMGTVAPQESVTVYPLVSGNVTALNAVLNAQVKNGDVLFNVDNTEATQVLAEAQKELELVKKEVEAAKKEAEAAEKEAETAKKEAEAANLKALEAAVTTKKAEMDSAKKDWDNLENDLEDLEEQLEDVEDGKISMSEYQKGRLEDKIEAKEKECKTAKTKYENAKKAYEDAKTAYENAKKGNTSTSTSTTGKNNTTSTTNKNNTSNSVSNTKNTVNALLEEKLAAAEKKVAEAQSLLNMYQVKAPFDGIVEAIYIDKNERVFEDTPCMVVSNRANMEVTFHVPEAAAKALHAGEKVLVDKDGSMYEASITAIDAMADPETKLFGIKASMGNISEFSTGSTVSVYAETKKALNVMKIPYDALYFQGGAAYVYCVVEGEAVRKEVQVGLMNEESAEIMGGLEAEDIVISTWSSQLKDGAEVNLLFVIGYEEPVVEEETPGDITLETTPEGELETEQENSTEEEYKWVLPELQ